MSIVTASLPTMNRLLLIDDDTRLATMVEAYLTQAGYAVTHAPDAQTGLGLLAGQPFDAVILDLMLPDLDGLAVCRRIRQAPPQPAAAPADIPIIMLTAKGDPTDRIIGLEIGADDYLPKPFEPRELLARLRALLRRRHGGASEPPADLRFGRLTIDRNARNVSIDGESRPLTTHQFDLLVTLAERAGRVLSRDALIELVQNDGDGSNAFDRSIDVHIARIRAAIEDDPKLPQRIVTVRGAGYVFAKEQA